MSNKLYQHICQKYPNVQYNGEDLSLDNLYVNEVKKRWLNTIKYPTVTDIVVELRLSERQVYRLAKKNNLGSRWTHHKNNNI
jgi:transcriptional accessory protein Tex/SPT6